MTTIKYLNQMELEPGMIVHAHGARFEVYSTKIVTHKCGCCEDDEKQNLVKVAHAKWLDGEIVPGYFGPDNDWNFQGNYLVSQRVEA